jgi:DNA-binding MarR family transcriptional regulator
VKRSNDFLTTLNLSKIATYQAGIVQSAAHRLLQRETNDCLKIYNLTTMEWFALGYIHDNHHTRISDMAADLHFTMPYATNVTNSLQAKGFLTRADDDTDNRSKLLELTVHANEIFTDIEKSVRKHLRRVVYGKVSLEDFHTYIKVLYALSD